MKKILFTAILGLVLSFPLAASAQSVELKQVWATDAVLEVPESVYFYWEEMVLFVSNIKGTPLDHDGNGYISRLSLDGKILEQKWVTGLDAPKGMGVWKNSLFVTDINRVVEIDIRAGKIVKEYKTEGKFLNDISVDRNGDVYISDMETNRIYRIRDGKIEIWLESVELDNPNGVLVTGRTLWVNGRNTGTLKRVDLSTKQIRNWTDGLGSPDGLETDEMGNFIISSWPGQIFYVFQNRKSVELLDTREQKINSADIEYVPGRMLVLVPTFFDNRVVAYQVVHNR
jgi:hypothetical protein